jgi:nitrogen fixation/metabolism regulation signal transduction histidine kinase
VKPPRRSPLKHETRLLLLALLGGLPAVALSAVLLWTGGFEPRTRWTLALFVGLWWLGCAFTARERTVRPLQTLSNLLAGLREGDFSTRARGARADDALGLALLEVNALSRTLRDQRLGALEATALLRTVMAEIPVAVFAFDERQQLQLANRAAEQLLGRPAARLKGLSAPELGLATFLEGEAPRTLDHAFAGAAGRWEVRRGAFRQGGRPHQLLVLADLSRALREEERQAWQRLVRVLGHEINNSLAPIHSIAQSLSDLLAREPRPADWEQDAAAGLTVIGGRAGALARFMAEYARLARLPAPALAPLSVGEWVQRVAALEPRLPVRVVPGPSATLCADGDQLDQLLINLVRNAVDASLETGGSVEVAWAARDGRLELCVRDEGPGLAATGNLFVPFFTTKPDGSGIGLALARQIAEAHGGTLTLVNRSDGCGCEASVMLPLIPAQEHSGGSRMHRDGVRSSR